MFSIAKSQKYRKKFECIICDYNTCNKYDYEKHTKTEKHIKNHLSIYPVTNYQKIAEKSLHEFTCCNCNKIYKDHSGLWRHRKKCKPNENSQLFSNKKEEDDVTEKELIIMLLKQNSQLIEQNAELVKNGIQNTNNYNNTNINSHNKSFNLQFFLNETCKDAMNIMDFVDSIQLQLSDLEKVGEIGYVDGISNIIVKHLKALDVTKRPVHCTDKKRETMYIKDQDKWEKEDNEKNKIRKFIKKIANKNIRLLQNFKEKHPDCGKSESKYSDQYNKLIVESMGGSGDNDLEKEDKIIKKITKEVIINK
jgi:hypothetical protein